MNCTSTEVSMELELVGLEGTISHVNFSFISRSTKSEEISGAVA